MALFLSFEDDDRPKRLSLRERMRLKENEAMSQQVTVKKILRTEQTKTFDGLIEHKVKKSVTFETTDMNGNVQSNGISTEISTENLGNETKTKSVNIQQSISSSRYGSNVGEKTNRNVGESTNKNVGDTTHKNEKAKPKEDLKVSKTAQANDTNNTNVTFSIQKNSDKDESKQIVINKSEENVIEVSSKLTSPILETAKKVETKEESKTEDTNEKEESKLPNNRKDVVDSKKQQVDTKKTSNIFEKGGKQEQKAAPEKRRPVSMTNITSKFENTKPEKRPLSAVVEKTYVDKKEDKPIYNELDEKKTHKTEETKSISPKTELSKVNLRKTNDKPTTRPKSLNDFKSKFESKPQHAEVNNRRSLVVGNNRSKFEQNDSKSFNVNLKTVNESKDKTLSEKISSKQNTIGDSKVTPLKQTIISKDKFAEKDEQVREDNKLLQSKNSTPSNRENASLIKETSQSSTDKNKTIERKPDNTTSISEKTTKINESVPNGIRKTEKIEKVETDGKTTLKQTFTRTTEVKQSSTSVHTIKTDIGSKSATNNVNVPLKLNLKSNAKSISIDDKLKNQKKNTRTPAKSQNMFKLQISAEAASKPAFDPLESKANSNIDKLLKWIAKRVNIYPCVKVTNFTTSWEDGIALCALMHHLLGEDAITPTDVSSTDKLKNFEMAIKAATDAGVPALVEPNELANAIDRRSMITYLHTVYKVLVADKKK